ncbi:MAG: hypothetical protein IJI44_04870 [Erysipelotrichaceae bacterium]|nr:hypothetical protein [Erysipelotrichaceae bacterium]
MKIAAIRKRKGFLIGLSAVSCAAVVLILFLSGTFRKEMIVGKDIKIDDINEFYFTWSGSTYPPEFQRYRFYVESDRHYFYHETREGDHWPLTENDITVHGTLELSDEEWEKFFDGLKGSRVKAREENLDSGDSGPWLYLYWKGDCSKYQELSFPSWEQRNLFEAYCIELKEMQE